MVNKMVGREGKVWRRKKARERLLMGVEWG